MRSTNFDSVVSPRLAEGGQLVPPPKNLADQIHQMVAIIIYGMDPNAPLDLSAIQADPRKSQALQILVKILRGHPELKDVFVRDLMSKLPPLQQAAAMQKLKQVGLV